MMVVAATNEWRRAFWPDVVLDSSGLVVYGHGWWFWIASGYGHALVLTGAALLLDALRRSPPPFRGQWLALLAVALVPLAGNAA